MHDITCRPAGCRSCIRRFNAKCHVLANGCIEWTGARTKSGYPELYRHGHIVRAHRFAYGMAYGKLNARAILDHLCNNRGCVNFLHLVIASNRDNILRGTGPTAINARKTHCKRGHPLDFANTYIRPNGHRQCRACHQIRNRKYRSSVPSIT